MATYEQYQQQLLQRRSSLQEASQNVQAQRIKFTKRQLRQSSRLQRQRAAAGFRQQKQQAQAEISRELVKQKELEEEFKPKLESYKAAKAAAAAAAAEAAQWKEAERLVRAGQAGRASGSLYKKTQELQEMGLGSSESQVQQAQERLIERKAAVAEALTTLPTGEELIYDKGYNVKEIKSEYFGGTFTPEKYSEKVKELSRKTQIDIPESVMADIEKKGFETSPVDLARQRGISVVGSTP